MKGMGLTVVLLTMAVSAQAETHKCKQVNGNYLFSDKPCITANLTTENTRLNHNGTIVHLSTRPEPIPLPNVIVNQFFTGIETACKSQNGEQLLGQYSQRMQESIKLHVGNGSVFATMSYVCKEMKIIREEIAKSSGQVLFASKMPNKAIELCFYKPNSGLDNCRGNIKIIAEENRLKLDGY